MKIDMHCHTYYSICSSLKPEDMVKAALRRKLDGIAVTDHDSMKGVEKVRQFAKKSGLFVMPGCEVSSRSGHILVHGINEPIRKGMTIQETTDAAHKQGAVVAASHPYMPLIGVGGIDFKTAGFDGIDVKNSSCVFSLFNERAGKAARKFRLAELGGSDSHTPREVGDAYTVFSSGSASMDSILKQIRKRRTRACGRLSSPLVHIQTSINQIKAVLGLKN